MLSDDFVGITVIFNFFIVFIDVFIQIFHILKELEVIEFVVNHTSEPEHDDWRANYCVKKETFVLVVGNLDIPNDTPSTERDPVEKHEPKHR